MGPGHHGEDEYEYEIHHFEKFHDESMVSIFPHLPISPLIKIPQTPKKKTSSTPKTSPTSPSTSAKNSKPSASKNSTSKPSTKPTSPPNFGGSPNHPPQSRHSRTFYFIMALLCWNRFWLFAAVDFKRYHPLTYFVLYISLVLLAWVLLAWVA